MLRFYLGLMVVCSGVLLAAEDNPASRPAPLPIDTAAKEQLSKMQQLVGQWRGVGQPQRSSTKDSWVEEADWAWSFADGPQLVAQLPKTKYFKTLRLVSADKEFVLRGTPAGEGDDLVYRGGFDDAGRLVLDVDKTREGFPSRISMRFVAEGARLLILLEKKSPTSDQLTRLAEVGYTRQGSGFGKNVSQRECVVTGGLGTIEVSYEGKTYYVCCTGCRDYFNDNPKEVLADYFARKEAEKQKK